jgi:hypothetical protein
MSNIVITFDAATKEFSCQLKELDSFYAAVALFVANPEELVFNELQIGVDFSDNVLGGDQVWPAPGITVLGIDTSQLLSYQVNWKPDDQVGLRLWLKTDAENFEYTTSFVVPKPPQPYPSWSWDGTFWKPPVPKPFVLDKEVVWDETAGEWIQLN